MVWFKRLLIKFPWNALLFGIRKVILASFGSVKIMKEMCQFFVNIPVCMYIYTYRCCRRPPEDVSAECARSKRLPSGVCSPVSGRRAAPADGPDAV